METENKKIAVIYTSMDNIGGAEIVGLTLARELKADIYTTNIDEDKIKKMGFTNINLKSIGQVPINAPFRHQMILQKFRKLNLGNQYDFYIIDGDWAISAVVNNKPNLWYVHSPIREIWDLYKYTRKNIVPFYFRPIFDFWVKYNRQLNRKYAEDVGIFVCNSETTQKRLKRYLNKNATVINPPIETADFYYRQNGDYWLSVNRLITHKRVDLQVKAFAKLPEKKLIIVGSYEKSKHFQAYANYIKKLKTKNITILSWVDRPQLIDLYANCKGFITTSKDEDFGMTAVEAMAAGKPVIASAEGGYRETVIDNITGKLIDNINVDKLIEAIKEIEEGPEKYKDACLKQAKKFDTKIFIGKIKEQMKKYSKE
ncbi:MAG: glycosyltransferase [Patescibacteria group bacterium]|nr:glycosyltransferase [Patescibacteria group bacterium]